MIRARTPVIAAVATACAIVAVFGQYVHARLYYRFPVRPKNADAKALHTCVLAERMINESLYCPAEYRSMFVSGYPEPDGSWVYHWFPRASVGRYRTADDVTRTLTPSVKELSTTYAIVQLAYSRTLASTSEEGVYQAWIVRNNAWCYIGPAWSFQEARDWCGIDWEKRDEKKEERAN